MDRLSIPHPERGCADLCFATSMIEVGIDIDRLGLLTMFGQPKSASQYIQVAGRIGRDERQAPGVVFVLLSPYNSRDRSHFEQFSSFHRRLYASVEPVSITPFTPAALDRGLAGALSAWVRQATGADNPQDALSALKDAIAPIASRAREGTEEQNLRRRFDELEGDLAATTHTTWGVLRPNRPPEGFLRPLGDDTPPPADSPDTMNTTWSVPTSMRSVDAEAAARTIERSRQTGMTAGDHQAVPGEDLF
jgi:superfamily II DNA/RNA helicase